MAAKITRMTAELYILLVEAWHKNSVRMCDPDKSIDTLEWRLFEDAQTAWYQGPGRSWMYISEIDSGGNANMHVLNLDGQEAVQIPEARQVMREMMQEFNLKRLSLFIASPLVKIAHAAQVIGFSHEGRMRDAAQYGGRTVDVEVFGLTRPEIEDGTGKKKRKRKRRSRRKGKETKCRKTLDTKKVVKSSKTTPSS